VRAIDGKRPTRRHRRRPRGTHNQGVESRKLFLEQANGVLESRAAQGIAADKFGK
jgi:hypothetical protein